jgi:hypothetical protein
MDSKTTEAAKAVPVVVEEEEESKDGWNKQSNHWY